MQSCPWKQPRIVEHSRLLAHTFWHWTGRSLLAGDWAPEEGARQLYHAPFVLVSHGTEPDPLFNYANLAAQRLWELDWAALVGMPSRRTAETDAQGERAQVLRAALRSGFVEGYSGVRISGGGRRFWIRNGVIWNVLDEAGNMHGQAATFADWDYL
jgi:hypothetical protein